MSRPAEGQGLCPWTPLGPRGPRPPFLKEGKEGGITRRVETHGFMPTSSPFLKLQVQGPNVYVWPPWRGCRGQSPLAFGGTSA
jgi:hypothetical protein